LISRKKPPSIAESRARLVVRCAAELLGLDEPPRHGELRLQLSVGEFGAELRRRYGKSHPELALRSDSALERARLYRRGLDGLPKVVLRMGAPNGKRRKAKH